MKAHRQPPLIRASALLHIAAGPILIASPAAWQIVLAVLIANHALLVAAGLWPTSSWLGPNLRRLPPGHATHHVALTFDDGPDPEITPQVLEILARHEARATFFVVGRRAAEQPELIRQMHEAGHCIGNHTWQHTPWFFFKTGKGLIDEIRRTQEVIQALCGVAPALFRAPAGIRGPFLQTALGRTRLKLVSWTRRGFDTVEDKPDRILRRLLRNLRAGDVLLLHDHGSVRTATGTPVVIEVLPRLLEALHERGLTTGPIS